MDQLCGANAMDFRPPTLDGLTVLSLLLKKVGDTAVMLVYNSLEIERYRCTLVVYVLLVVWLLMDAVVELTGRSQSLYWVFLQSYALK